MDNFRVFDRVLKTKEFEAIRKADLANQQVRFNKSGLRLGSTT